jgi:hypothetical protein
MCGCGKNLNKPRHANPISPRRIQAVRAMPEPAVRQMALRKQVNDAAIKAQQQRKIKTVKQRVIKDKLSR